MTINRGALGRKFVGTARDASVVVMLAWAGDGEVDAEVFHNSERGEFAPEYLVAALRALADDIERSPRSTVIDVPKSGTEST